MQEMEIRKNVRHLSKFSSQNAKFKSNSQGMERMTICATRSKPTMDKVTQSTRRKEKEKLGLCELCMRKDHSQQTCARKLKCFHCGSEHNSALCKKQYEMKQGKDYQIDERVKESPKTVAARWWMMVAGKHI
uniref:Eka-like protein n=1 Tax=Loa loa TaxID=7209 RepID=A0A1I7VYC9_LOALO